MNEKEVFTAGFNQALNLIQNVVNERLKAHKAKLDDLRNPPLIVVAGPSDPKREQLERLTKMRNVEAQMYELLGLAKNIEMTLDQMFPKKEKIQ